LIVLERWSSRLGVVWLLVLVGSAWYLGALPAEDGIPVAAWLVIGSEFLMTTAWGATLASERRGWLLVIPAALVGGFVTTAVFSIAITSNPDNGLGDSYYPEFTFIEFTVIVLAQLAIGVTIGAVWRLIRRVRAKKAVSAR